MSGRTIHVRGLGQCSKDNDNTNVVFTDDFPEGTDVTITHYAGTVIVKETEASTKPAITDEPHIAVTLSSDVADRLDVDSESTFEVGVRSGVVPEQLELDFKETETKDV